MDYPRALDSSPEDRGLGVRDWVTCMHAAQMVVAKRDGHYGGQEIFQDGGYFFQHQNAKKLVDL